MHRSVFHALLLPLLLGGCTINVVVRDIRPCDSGPSCQSALRETIESFWAVPECANASMSTTVLIRFVPGGGVLPARISQSSGYQEFDDSLLAAIKAASANIHTRNINAFFLSRGQAEMEQTFTASKAPDTSPQACRSSFVEGYGPVEEKLHQHACSAACMTSSVSRS